MFLLWDHSIRSIVGESRVDLHNNVCLVVPCMAGGWDWVLINDDSNQKLFHVFGTT